MDFWVNFESLCKEKNIKPSQLATYINVTPSAITGWKKGSPPNGERLIAIADYFGVSTDYLLGRTGTDPGMPEEERKLLENYRNASEVGKKLIQDMAEELTKK